MPQETYEWAICEADGSVSMRYRSEADAAADLADGGYPDGSYVQSVPEPAEFDGLTS